MIKYINCKTSQGVETIDVLDSNDFKDSKEFKREIRRLISEYNMAGMNAYISIRSTKSYRMNKRVG